MAHRAFQANAFQNNAFQVGDVAGVLTVISTISGSPHPVDCYIEGSQPSVYERVTEFEVPPRRERKKVTVSTGGVSRLSKVAPNFTSKTGNRFYD